MNKCFLLIAVWYADLESPSTPLGVFSTHQEAYDYGCKWWQSEARKGYYCWKVVEVDYHG